MPSRDSAPHRRGYDAPRRREQAQQTRDDIAAAARRLFVARGWGQTTLREIAREARVSEPTIYNTYGGKVGLAVALVDTVDFAEDLDRMRLGIVTNEGNPDKQLAALVGYDRRLFERSGDVIRLMRDAGRTEPKLKAAYRRGRARGEEYRRNLFTGWPDGALAEGIDVTTACDTYAALCNVDVYFTLIGERRWKPDRVEQWWHESLRRLLLW